jgi:hypothetical protein
MPERARAHRPGVAMRAVRKDSDGVRAIDEPNGVRVQGKSERLMSPSHAGTFRRLCWAGD